MCVVALALNQHPDWPLLLVGNRDEFHARASAPLHAWDDGSGIIAGRDLVGGGTWLGVQPSAQRLVVVTNVRDARGPDPAKASRGALVRDLLTGAGGFAAPTAATLEGFNGFNLIAVAGGQARLMTNRPASLIRELPPGVHALANEYAETDVPRAARLTEVLQAWLTACTAPEALLAALAAQDPPPLFLHGDIYGTRCSTLVAVDAECRGVMIERRFGPLAKASGETRLVFGWGG